MTPAHRLRVLARPTNGRDRPTSCSTPPAPVSPTHPITSSKKEEEEEENVETMEIRMNLPATMRHNQPTGAPAPPRRVLVSLPPQQQQQQQSHPPLLSLASCRTSSDNHHHHHQEAHGIELCHTLPVAARRFSGIKDKIPQTGKNDDQDNDDDKNDDEEDEDENQELNSLFSLNTEQSVLVYDQAPITSTSSPPAFEAHFHNLHNEEDDNDNEQPPDPSSSSSSSSSQPLAAGSSLKAPTPLHAICHYAETLEELVQARHYLSAHNAATLDERGRTPLHLLSLNTHLAHRFVQQEEEEDEDDDNDDDKDEDADKDEDDHGGAPSTTLRLCESRETFRGKSAEKQLIHFVTVLLWRQYRPAMITPCHRGFIPFQEALTEWVEGIYDQARTRESPLQSQRSFLWISSKSFSSRWIKPTVVTKDMNNNNDDASLDQASTSSTTRDVEGGGGTSSLAISPTSTYHTGWSVSATAKFPKHIRLTAQAIFCFKLLSAMLDRIDRRLQSGRSIKRRPSLLQRQSEDEADCIDKALSRLRHQTVEDIGAEIVQSIASIPNLVPAVFLLEDDVQRNFVLSTLIMRRVLVSKYHVGFWLTNMLQSSEKRVSDSAISYLKVVSDPELFEGALANASSSFSTGKNSSWRGKSSATRLSTTSPKQNDHKHRNHCQNELYHQVSCLQDFVPSLLALGEKDVEEVANTYLVRKVLDYLISRPFASTVVLCDAFFLTLMIAFFRGAASRLLKGSSSATIVKYIYVANSGIFYFIIRELGKAVSLCMMTKRTRVYFLSFWNLADVLAPVLALASLVTIRMVYLRPSAPLVPDSATIRTMLALTTGFLWLRVLSFLKGINQQLATFILAILQVGWCH